LTNRRPSRCFIGAIPVLVAKPEKPAAIVFVVAEKAELTKAAEGPVDGRLAEPGGSGQVADTASDLRFFVGAYAGGYENPALVWGQGLVMAEAEGPNERRFAQGQLRNIEVCCGSGRHRRPPPFGRG
jgi:hypothetical protein